MKNKLALTIAKIEEQKENLISFCQDLVRIPSLSGKEGEIAKIVTQQMEALGYTEVSTDELGSVLGTLKGKNRISILFNGHMDHVPAGSLDNWSVDPFGATIKEVGGQRAIFGRGVVDMKGALAAQVFAGGMLCQLGITPPGDLHVAAVVHEEDHEGSAMEYIITQRGVRPDLVVLGEPTSLNLSIGQKGRCELEVVTKGRTSHGSKPELGINAVYHMAKIVEAVEQLNKQQMPQHEFLGRASVALIRISCSPGQGNVIPDGCRIVLDRRTLPAEREEDLIEEVNQFLGEVKAKVPNLDARVRIMEENLQCYTGKKLVAHKYYPAWAMAHSDPFIQKTKTILEAMMNSEVKIQKWDFSTDGVYTAGMAKIPTIGYGPGDETQAHSPDEHLFIDQLVTATKGYAALALNLGVS
ncbi:MAG: YgeY family selenium metabolism-linked hydrolase [Candidatus Heimdallarchaeota archaeon]